LEKYRELEAELDGLKDQSNVYGEAQTALMARYREASRELNELLSQRPELVAQVAMNQADEVEVVKARERIKELEAIIDECSSGNDWLEAKKKEIKHELDKRAKEPDIARRLLREYEQFRDQFPQKYQTACRDRDAPRGAVKGLFGALRAAARPVNRIDEAEGILAGYELPDA